MGGSEIRSDRNPCIKEKYADRDRLIASNATDKMVLSKCRKYEGEPVLLSEFGGLAMEDENTRSWGYHEKLAGPEKLLEKMRELFEAAEAIPYLAGYCYTQLTDVEQETNGLLDPDRNPKADLGKIREIVTGGGLSSGELTD